MKQAQLPVPNPDDENAPPDPLAQIRIDPAIEDMLKRAESLLDAGQKFAPIECCGILPCKGRTPACFHCELCIDCITGTGCSHPDSRHDPSAHISLGG